MTFLNIHFNTLSSLLAATLLAISTSTFAEVVIQISDQDGAPLENTTLVLTPMFDFEPIATNSINVNQINEQFVPEVSVVQVGTDIFFPNQDDIRHHVYSFSPAKQFDIPLYSGTPAEPINFDQTGIVELGCNIHDQMRGYILVTDSPYFGISNESGEVSITLNQAGNYQLSLWHPEEEAHLEPIEITIGQDLTYEAEFSITTMQSFFPRRGSSNGSYF